MEKSKNSRIWLDVTELLAWHGSVTGIQRVMYEYAVRLVADGAGLFMLDRVDERFVEIPFSLIKDKISQKSSQLGEPIGLLRQIRLKVGAPYYALPVRVKKILRPAVTATNRAVRAVVSKTIKGKVHVSAYRGYPQAIFSESDKVLMLGAGWNDPSAFDELCKLKHTIKFELIQHINDILPIYQPQLFADELPNLFESYMQKVVRSVDAVTVISEATKRDVEIYCREHHVKNLRIEVVRLGDDVSAVAPIIPNGITEREEFIFALGTFEVRKNYILLYQALKLAQLEDRDLPKIVIAGRKGWLSNDVIHQINHDPYMKDKLVWLDNVSDSELAWLFDHCLFTVFPSLAEGWGLPVVESLRHGKMSLVSGVSSMLEIGEGLVDYFLPYDARECMEKMHYYLADDRYVTANEKVTKNYKIYTWDESYASLKNVIIGI